jgi:hypothetical protein
MAHPMQDFVNDDGVVRFKRNAIVEYLLDNGGIDMNKIAMLKFSQEDRVQFAQLIGYSLNGFHELSYVPDSVALKASKKARKQVMSHAGGCRDNGCEIHCGVEEE